MKENSEVLTRQAKSAEVQGNTEPTIELVTSKDQEARSIVCPPVTAPCAPQFCIPVCPPSWMCRPMIPCPPQLPPPPPGCKPGPSRA
jgi:hypothetical protein